MKLFTIGDSISQGFMSGAAARTDLCYSTLIAKAMGLNPGSSMQENVDYYYPEWKKGGMPANLENILRKLNKAYGADIRGMEWVTLLHHINRVIDDSEDYYQKEEGRAENKYHGNLPYFHNIASWSFDIADTWLVTPELCYEEIKRQDSADGGDGWMSVANAAFYRSALKVLSPNLDSNFSQIDWVRHHAQTQGIENLLIWIGSNNALKTIITFKIMETPNDPLNRPHRLSHLERRKKRWNLWHPDDFREEYEFFFEQIHDIMVNYNVCKNWRVFIATIPYTTIVPILKGFGPKLSFGRKGIYYKNYTYLPFSDNYALKRKLYIPFHRAQYIDDCVREYNKIIRMEIKEKNELCKTDSHSPSGKDRYYIVDLCEAFNKMDWRKNNENPTYKYPRCFKSINPSLTTMYYHVDANGQMLQGGLFSLDGIHPTAIGHGLIANEFMKIMKRAGVTFTNRLDWREIFANDTLFQNPISLMSELYKHEMVAEYLIKLIPNYI